MKTRLYTRKRALISSVAMLLVAMIALGTATFAWFTSNPNASASGLKMKATASKGLVIRTASRVDRVGAEAAWKHTDYLDSNAAGNGTEGTSFELAPASFDPTTTLGTYYTVEAANDNNYAAANDATVASSTVFGDWDSCTTVYKEEIACKLTGTDSSTETAPMYLTSLNIDLKDNDKVIGGATYKQSHGVRVALLYTDAESTTSLLGIYNGTGAAVSNKYLTGAGTYSSKLAPADTNYSFPAAPATRTLVGNVDPSGNCKVTVIVYLDGEDTNVFTDSISAQDIVNSISVNLTVSAS